VKEFIWNPLKNQRLKRTRGVSFEEIIKSEYVLIMEHPARPDQKVLLFYYQGRIWVVPAVETGEGFLLKTLYPSRKYTKLYRRGELK
jgi:hypothetical protein